MAEPYMRWERGEWSRGWLATIGRRQISVNCKQPASHL